MYSSALERISLDEFEEMLTSIDLLPGLGSHIVLKMPEAELYAFFAHRPAELCAQGQGESDVR